MSVGRLKSHNFTKLYFRKADNKKATVNYMQLSEDFWAFNF